MRRSWRWPLAGMLLALCATAVAAADWYSRVERLGVKDASTVDIALFEKGQLPPSLHVGDCYFHLERWREGVAVFHGLRRKPDRNYAAAATVREAEGLVRLGERARAKALFETCLSEYPESFLDVDIPELCRAWLREIGDVEPAADDAVPDEKHATGRGDGAGLREEIRKLEAEVADVKKRIADLRRLLTEDE